MNANNTNTNTITLVAVEEDAVDLLDKFGNGLSWCADQAQDVASIAVEGLICAEARIESLVTNLYAAAPSIRASAKAKADARMKARLARYQQR